MYSSLEQTVVVVVVADDLFTVTTIVSDMTISGTLKMQMTNQMNDIT